MNRNETIDLFSVITLFDRRIVPDDPARQAAQVDAWLAILGDLPFGDAQTAVANHYRESSEWIMPADIRRRVKAMAAERLSRNPVPPPPPELTDDPQAYIQAMRGHIAEVTAGPAPLRAIEGGSR